MTDIVIFLCIIAFAVMFIVVFSSIYIPYVIDKEFDNQDKKKGDDYG